MPDPTLRAPRTLAALAPLALGLAACQGTPPGATDPVTLGDALVLPAAYDGADADPAPAASATWWHDLGAPRLAALVDEALAASPDLAAATRAVRVAALRLDAAGGADLPRVQASLGWTRARNNLIGIPIPGSGDVLTTYSTSNSAGLGVSWELDLWGRLAAREAGALAELEASEADWLALRQALAARITRLAVSLGQARTLELLTAEQLAVAEARLASARRLNRLGAVGPEAILAAEAAVEGLEADLVEARRAREVLAPALAALCARPAAELPSPDELAGLLDLEPPAAPPPGLPADLVARRPDLVALEARLEAAWQGALVARAERYPTISLTASGGTSGSELEDLVDGDLRVWSLGANVLAPLFTGGALEAAEDVAVAQRDAALFAFARGVLDALAEVETALVDEARTAERLADLERQLATLAEHEAVVSRRQARGSASADATFDARARTLAARAALAAARGQLLDRRIDLHLALGGDFQGALPGPAPTAR